MAKQTQLLRDLATELEARLYVVELRTDGRGDNPVCYIESKTIPAGDADETDELEPEDDIVSIGIEVADFGRDYVERKVDVRWVDLDGKFQSVSEREITAGELADRIVGPEPEPEDEDA